MKNKMKQKICCNIQIEANLNHKGKSFFKGDIFLKPNTTYSLEIDYPLGVPAIFEIKSGETGMGTNSLIGKICESYYKIYQNEEKYEIWGHCLGDLAIEGINVNHEKKTIELFVGS